MSIQEEKEKKKKDKREEVILVGRNLAWIKKKNPELYDYILNVAEEEGLTASDILERAIRYAFVERESLLERLTAREFLVMIDKWNELQTQFLKNLLDYVSMFFKLGFEKYTEIINAISETVREDMKKDSGEKKHKIEPEHLMSFLASLTATIPQMFTSIMNIVKESSKMTIQPHEIMVEQK